MTAVDQEQTESIRQLVPFAGALGVEVIASRPDEVRARVEWRPERCTTGGVALLCLGAGDVAEDHDPESWLGAPMFWSHFDAETNLEMLRDSGFDVIRDELVNDPMDHGRHLFALVAAH